MGRPTDNSNVHHLDGTVLGSNLLENVHHDLAEFDMQQPVAVQSAAQVGLAARVAASRKAAHMAVLDQLSETNVDGSSADSSESDGR